MRRGPVMTAAAVGLGALAARARGRTMRVAAAVEQMDADAHAQEISWMLFTREFRRDVELALSFALFRTYAVPSISVILEATGEFTQHVRRRYDDTELVISEMQKHGLDHERGRGALRRMNAMHAAYDIDPDDTLYTLTTFICEPVRWMQRWGWRPYTEHERRAWTAFFRDVGLHMGLTELPTSYAWYDEFNQRYEAERFAYHPANRAVADATTQLFLEMYAPAPLRQLGEVAVRGAMDGPLLEALGYDPAPVAVQRAVDAAMRARAAVQRTLLPEPRTPYDITQLDRPSYPNGYVIEQLGTFPTPEVRARANAAIAALREGVR